MARSGNAYPSKKTLNLVFKEKPNFRIEIFIPAVLLIVLAAAFISKVAVIDRYEEVRQLQAQAAGLRTQKEALEASLADYDETLELYNKYSTAFMTESEKKTINRLSMLSLIENEFMLNYRVLDISINGSVISLKIAGVTLDEMSGIVSKLYERDDVSVVEIFSASNKETYTVADENGKSVTVVDEIVSIVITMNYI